MPIAGLRRMQGRDPGEHHRASTPLELFFDLCFVVAVSFASITLHHGFLEGHGAQYTVGYVMVFFAIWWAWMGFSWFASAYDTDDWFYRIATLVQISGVLVLAAGVPDALAGNDYRAVTIGYLVMRVGLISQWIRVAVSHPRSRSIAVTFVVGLIVIQLGWVGRLWLPESGTYISFGLLVGLELSLPAVAARNDDRMPWHPGHIAERYGLFTLIVLGESVLAASNAVVKGIAEATDPTPLIVLAFAGLVIAFGMWWLYFLEPVYADLNNARTALSWGYGHYLVFASAAALSAGLELSIDRYLQLAGDPAVGTAGEQAVVLDGVTTAALTTVPVAVFLVATWLLMLRPLRDRTLDGFLIAAPLLTLAMTFTPAPIHLTALLMVITVAAVVSRGVRLKRVIRSEDAPAH
ncbi:MAG: low temperature requirement protein A [Nakamurella sp.]